MSISAAVNGSIAVGTTKPRPLLPEAPRYGSDAPDGPGSFGTLVTQEDDAKALSPQSPEADQKAPRYTIKAIPWQNGDYYTQKALSLYQTNQSLPTSSESMVEALPRINEII